MVYGSTLWESNKQVWTQVPRLPIMLFDVGIPKYLMHELIETSTILIHWPARLRRRWRFFSFQIPIEPLRNQCMAQHDVRLPVPSVAILPGERIWCDGDMCAKRGGGEVATSRPCGRELLITTIILSYTIKPFGLVPYPDPDAIIHQNQFIINGISSHWKILLDV